MVSSFSSEAIICNEMLKLAYELVLWQTNFDTTTKVKMDSYHAGSLAAGHGRMRASLALRSMAERGSKITLGSESLTKYMSTDTAGVTPNLKRHKKLFRCPKNTPYIQYDLETEEAQKIGT